MRIFFIKRNTEEFFKTIDSKMLKVLYAGLGHDWPDARILEHNGYQVRTSINLRGVVSLLEQQRVDYFPRGIHEIWREQAEMEGSEIVVGTGFALHYQSAYYIFVAKKDEALANIIERGLEKSIVDGSFDRMFYSYFGNDISRAHLASRVVFDLENPDLPKETPLWRKELWFSEEEASSILGSP